MWVAALAAWPFRLPVTSRFPHFRFHLADVYNKKYNPAGLCKASEYRFPFDDQSFDFVFLTSIFTHITYFLLNDESRSLLRRGKSAISFQYDTGMWMAVHESKPEDAIAYDEEWIRDLHVRVGLEVRYPIHFGSWCGRGEFLSFQDIVVAKKP